MAHEAHKLAIFRGRLKFKSNEQKIYMVVKLVGVDIKFYPCSTYLYEAS